jgi:calcium-dependent protein kinase
VLQILKHDWLVKEGVAYDISLDSVVLKRMKQFAQVRVLCSDAA